MSLKFSLGDETQLLEPKNSGGIHELFDILNQLKDAVNLVKSDPQFTQFKVEALTQSIEQLNQRIQEYRNYFNSEDAISIQSAIHDIGKLMNGPKINLDDIVKEYTTLVPSMRIFKRKFCEMLILSEQIQLSSAAIDSLED